MAVGHLRADGIMDRELRTAALQHFTDARILRRTLGGLGKNFHGLGKVQRINHFFQHFRVFHHQGVSPDLSQKAQHLRMAHPAEDEDLPVSTALVQADIGLPDPALQLQHHRTGTVDHFQMAGSRRLVGGGRFAVCADKDRPGIRDVGKGFHRHQAAFLQAGQFGLVVDDGTQGIQPVVPGEVTLSPGDGPDNPSAEAGTAVYLHIQHDRPGESSRSNFP